MAKKVKANGKTFTFDDDVTNEQIGSVVDEYFSSLKKKQSTVESASISQQSELGGMTDQGGVTKPKSPKPSFDVSSGIQKLKDIRKEASQSYYEDPTVVAKREKEKSLKQAKAGGAGDSFMAGVAGVNKSLAKIPRFVYGLAAVPQNAAASMLNMPELKANYNEVLEAGGYQSPLSVIDRLGDIAAGQEDKYNARVKKYDDDIVGSISKGNFADAGAQVVNNIAGSIPSMILMATTGGIGNAAKLGYYEKTLLNALPFASGKMQELSEDPTIPEYIKPITASLNGLAEVIFDQKFGTQAAIDNIVKIFKQGGKEAADVAAKEFTEGYINKALKQLGIAGKSISKGSLEEVTTTFAQNITDKYTINPDKNLMDGVADAAIVGGLTTGGVEIGGKMLAGRYNKNQKKELTTLAQQRSDIIDDLDKDNVSEEVKNTLKDALDVVEAKIEGITEDAEAEIDIMPSQVQGVVTEKQREIESLSNQLQDENISPITKQVITDKIKALEAEVNNIIDNANKPQSQQEIRKSELLAELESITDDNNPRIAEIDAELEELENIKQQENAIQIETRGQVPVQPEARVGEEVEQGKPQPEVEGVTEEGGKEEEKLAQEINKEFGIDIFVARKPIKLDGKDYIFSQINENNNTNTFIIEDNDGNEIGRAQLNEEGGFIENIRINEANRRQGIANNLYDFVEKRKNIKLKPSPIKLSKEAQALWNKRDTAKEATTQAPQQTVGQLRAQEQAEYAAMANPKDKVERQKIYDKYDKPITDAIREAKQEGVVEEISDIVNEENKKNQIEDIDSKAYDLDEKIKSLSDSDKKKKIVIFNKIKNLIGGAITFYKNGKFFEGKTKEVNVIIKQRGGEAPNKSEIKEAINKLESENKGDIFNIRVSKKAGNYTLIGDLVIKPLAVEKEYVQDIVNESFKKQPKTEAPQVEVSKLQTAKDRMAAAKAKLKGAKLGIAQDSEQKAKDLFEYHSAIVEVAKIYIADAVRNGITTAKQFAKAIGENLTKGVQEAWDEASAKEGVTPKTLESFAPKKKTVVTEPIVEEKVVLTPEQTVRNADVAAKRAIYGFNEPLQFKKQTNPETIEKAVRAIKSGVKPLDIVQKALNREALSDVEVAILNIYQQNKESELLKADEEIESMTDSGAMAFSDEVSKRDVIFVALLRAYDASETAGNVSGRALQARKAALKQDYSFASMIIKARKANNNEQLSKEKSEEVLKKYKEIMAAKDALKRRVAFLEDQNNKLKLKGALAPLIKEAALESRGVDRTLIKDKLKAEREDLFKQFNDLVKASRSELGANPIKLEMFPIIAKLAKNYLKEGAINAEGLVDKLFIDLAGSIDGLTKAHVREALVKSQEETEVKPTQEELIEEMTEAKSELESVSKEEVDEKEKKRLDTYKKGINKRIQELADKIKNKDYAKKVINPVLLDKEALDLQRKYAKLKYDFDLDMARDRLAKRTLNQKLIDAALDKANIPRALMASADFSAPLRQSLTATISHPILAARAGLEMFGQAGSAERAENWLLDLKESQGYQLIQDSGLYIADSSNPEVSAREEDFGSNLANYVPGVKASERAYSAYLNKMRVDIFSQGVNLLLEDGMTFANNPAAYKSLATFVNASTGRGDLGKFLERGSKYLAPLFFSPRFLASRLQLLSGSVLFGAPPAVKKMYIRDIGSTIAFGLVVLALFKYRGGADVEDDPRSSDFGKIRLGDTRWDIWGGFQQPVRYIIQFLSGQKKSSASGKIEELDGTNYNKQTRLGVVGNFFRSKLAPLPAMAVDAMAGENMVGERFDLAKNWHKSITPLVWQGIYDSANQDGWAFGLLATGLPSTFGVGVQSYAVNNFLQKGVDDKSIKLLLSKKATAIEPKEHDKMIYDVKTGEERKMTTDEFKNYYDIWANYIKDNLKENHNDYASMSNEKFEEKFRKIKTQASTLAKETVSGITSATKKINITIDGEEESFDLTPEQIKLRVDINKDFISKNKSIYNSIFRSELRLGKSDSEAAFIAKNKLESMANKFSKEKLLKKYRKNGKYDFKNK